MLMALNSRGWTELTEPCKCPSVEDEDVKRGGCEEEFAPVFGGDLANTTYTLGHQQNATHPHTHTLHTRQNQGPLEAQSVPEGSLDVLLMLSDANDLHSTTGASGEAVTRDHISAPATQLCTSYCSQATGIIQYTVINIADTFLPFVYFCVVDFTKGLRNNNITAGALRERVCVSVCVCMTMQLDKSVQSFGHLPDYIENKSPGYQQRKHLLLLSPSKEKCVFSIKASSSGNKKEKKTCAKPPLGRWEGVWGAFSFVFSYFISPTLSQSLCCVSFASVEEWGLLPTLLSQSLSPHPLLISTLCSPTWLCAFESIIILVSQCDRSLWISY